jgi:amidohydrolase
MLKEKIKSLAQHYHAEITGIRRYIHENPELSFKEVKTGQYIAAQLTNWGIAHEHGCAVNGVVGLIEGKKPASNGKKSAKVIALRADIDALPIKEANNVPYKSKNEGIMHACGHDAHTASLLGVAKILRDVQADFSGTVKLIFQPAEEMLPGGAAQMIQEGVLENPKPDFIIGQHVYPNLEAGKVGLRGGVYMASTDELYVTVKGRGGHGAMPHECIDPVVMTAQIIMALQQVVSRYANPLMPSVLTFGKINSTGGATNIIPEEVKLQGTFRTLDEKWRIQAHSRMKKIAEGIAKAMGGACEFRIEKGYPVLVNDEKLTQRAQKYAVEFLGKENVIDLPIRMTAEDFAYYSQAMPACFYRLGTRNEARRITSGLHTDTFDIEENALETGMGLMSWMALRDLGNE